MNPKKGDCIRNMVASIPVGEEFTACDIVQLVSRANRSYRISTRSARNYIRAMPDVRSVELTEKGSIYVRVGE